MRYYIIHYPLREKFFHAISWKHSSETAKGYAVVEWSSHSARLIVASELKQLERDLRELGEDGFTTSSVDL